MLLYSSNFNFSFSNNEILYYIYIYIFFIFFYLIRSGVNSGAHEHQSVLTGPQLNRNKQTGLENRKLSGSGYPTEILFRCQGRIDAVVVNG